VAEAVAADVPEDAGLRAGLAEVASLPAGGSHGWRLPARPESVPAMRRELRMLLDDTDLPDGEVYDLLLAACEATTNAIEHACEPTEPFVDVLFEVVDGRVTIVVRDHGRWRDGPATLHRGRGLPMMRLLADTAVQTYPHGTTVTLRSRPSAASSTVPDAG
jgi:anti-sigma regulatory factor (Ser/Thr protein kinase)